MKNPAPSCTALVYVTSCIFMLALSLVQANDSSSHAPLVPGLEYLHHRIGGAPLSLHVVKIDRAESEFTYTASLAQGTVLGLQSLSRQIQALDPNLGRALVAVNGDFFRIRSGPFQGDPHGLQLCQGELVSSPQNLSFWIDTQPRPHIGHVRADFQITWPDKTSIPFAVNQEPDPDQAVLYTPTMGPSTRTEDGIELVLGRCTDSPWLPLKAGQICRAHIVSVNHDPNSAIPPTSMILHLRAAITDKVKVIEPGTILSLSFKTTPDLSQVETAISGGPLLIHEGRPQSFSAPQPRHPRTAIGWNETHYVLLVVDGRQKDLSRGMTFPELADYMLDLGCTEAMNLDGGGSSTLWLNGRIVNSPSDGQERRIANGLILLQKNRE